MRNRIIHDLRITGWKKASNKPQKKFWERGGFGRKHKNVKSSLFNFFELLSFFEEGKSLLPLPYLMENPLGITQEERGGKKRDGEENVPRVIAFAYNNPIRNPSSSSSDK